MEFILNREILSSYLDSLSRAVASRPIRPILNGVHFDLKDGLTLTATDMEFTVRSKIPDVKGDKSFVVDAKTINEIVKSLPDKEVKFSIDGQKLEILSGKSKFQIFIQDGAEFPDVKVPSDGIEFSMKRTQLYSMLERVAFSAATDENMKNLNGVYIEIENGISRAVAVDGFRMALVEGKIDEKIEINFLLSLRAVKELLRVLSLTNVEDVNLKFENRQISFEFDNMIFICKIVDAEFPNYKRVIPDEFKTKIIVDRNELRSAVRRVSIITRSGSETVKFNIEKDRMKISSKSADLGEAEEVVDIQMEGEPIMIAFNPNFILDALNHTDEDKIQLSFVDSNKPLMIDTVDLKGYFFIIMPVRL
ncbi:DNA polymerase III subunit beta [Athalassotoga saccharophila]|uniref:DNA polymerase III subunit beta n=1 Tax=Athalassotoga saccharophila TaxID=1441386 RepID=UPI0013793D40|nr:DNA polymerase III subunit beta [Athalassotoga saccharophila]BBJ28334.1 DNA polymerase III beta subunit [Athalassotoga saccharophila]